MPTLIAAFDDPDPRTRLAVVGALRDLKTPEAAGALADLAGHRDAAVRAAVASALRDAAPAASTGPALARLAADRSATVRTAAAASLYRLTPFAPLMYTLRQDPNSVVRAAAGG